MTSDKNLVIHLGYHKTGSSSIQKWLLDHRQVLSDSLKCYNLADGSSNSLKFATNAWRAGAGSEEGVVQQCRDLVREIRTLPQKNICISDESLLGMPLGFSNGSFIEDGIYPFARKIVSVLAREFSEFSPVFVIFERDSEKWLKSVHNQMYKQGCVHVGFEDYLAQFVPQLRWDALRAEIEQGIENYGRLEVLSFEDEFARPTVALMTFFHLLNLPATLLARCRPQLEQINPSVPISKRRPDLPKAMVLGGSNSLIANGWVNLLRREYNTLVHINNLSVGACTSAMGLYRMLSRDQSMPGAAVIWEYGINEYNHMAAGQSLPSLLYHIEWVLQICIREKRPFVPLLMRNKVQALAPCDDAYVSAVTDLFARYNVIPVDCHRLLHILMRSEHSLDQWYSDPAHYSTQTEFPRRVAETAILALETARVPTQVTERAAHFDRLNLQLCHPDCAVESLDNSIVNCTFASFENEPVVDVPGRALAAIIVTSGSGPVIRLVGGDKTLGVYATQIAYGAGYPARQLRQLVLADEASDFVIPGGRLQVSIEYDNVMPIVQNMYTRAVPPGTAQSNGLVAILGEVLR